MRENEMPQMKGERKIYNLGPGPCTIAKGLCYYARGQNAPFPDSCCSAISHLLHCRTTSCTSKHSSLTHLRANDINLKPS